MLLRDGALGPLPLKVGVWKLRWEAGVQAFRRGRVRGPRPLAGLSPGQVCPVVHEAENARCLRLERCPGKGICLLSAGLTHPVAGSGAQVKAGSQPRSPSKGQEGVAPSLSARLEPSTEHSSQRDGVFICVWPPFLPWPAAPTRQAMGGRKSGVCFLFQAALPYQAGLGPGLSQGRHALLHVGDLGPPHLLGASVPPSGRWGW